VEEHGQRENYSSYYNDANDCLWKKKMNSLRSFLQKYVLPVLQRTFAMLILIWLILSAVNSFFYWPSIASSYPLKEIYNEDRLFFQNVQIDLVPYINRATIGADKSRLFLEVDPHSVSSFFNSSISIPWSDISIRKVSTIPLFPDIELKLSKVPGASIRIYQSQEDWIKHKVGDSWPNER
jgi:hypothetical protein